MIVLCTGGESCGTRLAARLVEQMGGRAVHRSCPHGGEWPDLASVEFDAAMVMTRDWSAVIESQFHVGHVHDRAVGEGQLRRAYAHLAGQLERIGRPWRLVSYEALVLDQEPVLAGVAGWLGLDAAGVTERVTDENAKWLRG